MDALLGKCRDLASIAAIDDAYLRIAVDFAHESYAARAEDAAIAIEHQRRTEVDIRTDAFAVEDAAREVHAALGVAEPVRKVLQRAFAAFVAHRTVERMVDEKKLE